MLFHRSHQRRLILIGIGIIIIVGGLYYYNQRIKTLKTTVQELEQQLLTTTPTTQNSSGLITATESYTNQKYHYQLLYPKNLSLKTYTDEKVAIVDQDNKSNDENDNAKAYIVLVQPTTSQEKKLTLENFILNAAKNLCAAEGGGVSISCPKEKNQTPLLLDSKLPAYALTLERQEKTFGPEASTLIDESTFFAIDLSTEKQRSILMIYPVGDGSIELVKKVASTVARVE